MISVGIVNSYRHLTIDRKLKKKKKKKKKKKYGSGLEELALGLLDLGDLWLGVVLVGEDGAVDLDLGDINLGGGHKDVAVVDA
jgi:hypothetical protein